MTSGDHYRTVIAENGGTAVLEANGLGALTYARCGLLGFGSRREVERTNTLFRGPTKITEDMSRREVEETARGSKMKSRRQAKILEIIKNERIRTQGELVKRLREEGEFVTQATVSRDIKDMRLTKVPAGNGDYMYAPGGRAETTEASVRLRRVFRENCTGIDHSENIIVVKSYSGTAPAVGEAIDNLGWREIVGTVAGDNTLLVVVKPKEAAPAVVRRLKDLMS